MKYHHCSKFCKVVAVPDIERVNRLISELKSLISKKDAELEAFHYRPLSRYIKTFAEKSTILFCFSFFISALVWSYDNNNLQPCVDGSNTTSSVENDNCTNDFLYEKIAGYAAFFSVIFCILCSCTYRISFRYFDERNQRIQKKVSDLTQLRSLLVVLKSFIPEEAEQAQEQLIAMVQRLIFEAYSSNGEPTSSSWCDKEVC